MNVQSPLESEDDFLSVTWDSPSTAPTASTSAPTPSAVESDDPSQEDDSPAAFQTTRSSAPAPGADWEDEGSKWDGWLDVRIVDYKKELEGGKESHVTFGVEASVSPHSLSRPNCLRVEAALRESVQQHGGRSSMPLLKGTAADARTPALALASLRAIFRRFRLNPRSEDGSRTSFFFTTTWPRTSRPASSLRSRTSIASVRPSCRLPSQALHTLTRLRYSQSTYQDGIDSALNSWRSGLRSELARACLG